jgi:hypothetical protein
MPISPDSAGMLTWTLKGALGQRFAIASSFMRFSEVGNVHIGGLVDGLQTNNVSKKPALQFSEALSVPFAADDASLKMAYLVRKCKR